MTQAPQRIGLYGGAFDPPHRTHVDMAQRFVAQARLDALHLCPTAGAWHKERGLTESQHRLHMCETAFAGVPGVVIDTCEIDRGGPSFTVDTLEQLRRQYPQAQLFLLMGRDQFERLHTWHALERIESLATLCVADRQGPPAAALQLPSHYMALQGHATDDSATVVRERRHAGQPIDDLVTPAVARYIADHHLYL